MGSEWFAVACVLIGCFWIGTAIGYGIVVAIGFYGGFMWATMLGRRNARQILDQMIADETLSVADRARREDVERVAHEAQRIGEAAALVLEAMTGKVAP